MLPESGTTKLTQIPKVLEKIKLGFVIALRESFACSLTDPSLKYSSDVNQTKIKIYTAHPLRLDFFPTLVVFVSGGDLSVNYLQDEFTVSDHINEVTYSGKIEYNINITIYTRSTLERERIIDHLTFFIRHLFKDVFRNYNVEYTKAISVGSENIFEVDNSPVYEQTIIIPCYTEYSADVDLSALDTIRSIIIDKINLEIMEG